MAPLPPDPYKTLGVSRTAPIADIRTAYRKLVLTCHPDKVQDPTQKTKKLEEFQKLQHAYELLSDEKERLKYDEQVKLMEQRKEQSKNMANTSAPRTPRTYNVSIRTEVPRPSPYAQSPPQAGSRLYAQYSHSPKEDFIFEEAGMGRSAKRTQSYDKRSSRKEKDWDEDKEREKHRRRREKEKEEEREEREMERERERERERRSSDKEARKAEKKRQDKERKHAQEEKRRHASPAYVEEYSGDGETPKSEKKKSSRKHREREREREATPRVEELTDTTNTRLSAAESYIQSRRMPTRASTFDTVRSSPPSVPTPPPPRDSPYPVPPGHDESDDDDDDEEEDVPLRSRAAARRSSYDPPRSKDRGFLHKRSFATDEPLHMSTSPSHLAAMAAESPPRGSFSKSSTFHEGGHRSAGRPTQPQPARANTFGGETSGPRGRSRSRLQPQVSLEIDEEEDEVELRQARKQRSSRREPQTDPIAIPRASHSYYGGEGRSLGREYRPSYEARSKTYMSSSGSSGYVVEPSFSSRSGAHFSKVRTRKPFVEDDVAFSKYGTSYQEIGTYH
ncbi:hypothetical protein VUR80DRAFT_1744 [Thermomyces stellatus]